MKNPITSFVVRYCSGQTEPKYEQRTYFTYLPGIAAHVERVTGGITTVFLEADGTPVFKVDYKIPVR